MKRIACLLLAAVLLLSGCGLNSPEDPSSTTTEPTATELTTTAPATTAPSTSETEPGETVKLDGWLGLDGKRYYYVDGVMFTGWLEQGYDRYYFTEDGAMAVGKLEIDGETCYFGSDGKQIALVNPWNYVPDWYVPDTVALNDWQYIDARCYDALMEMLQACRDAGFAPYVASAYRTHEHQIYLHNNKIQRLINEGYSEEEARQLAGTVVAVPGTSEHELGLAVDLVDSSYRNLDEAQENTATQKWFMENSWRYGFILRYPNEKSAVTGIIYEPWHYRYVGKTVAKEIYESGLCLEEYLERIG